MWEKKITAAQEQAAGAWISNVNRIRAEELASSLKKQNLNLRGALEEMSKLKQFVGNPEKILGSELSKHGEIAENVQVRISNARSLVNGLKAEYTFEGVGRTAPEDYLKNGQWVQSKYYNSTRRTLDAVREHLEKYPYFVEKGGCYDIPKDYYARIEEILNKPKSQLLREELTILDKLKELEKLGVKFDKELKGGLAAYSEVQQNKVGEMISREEKAIERMDDAHRNRAYRKSRASFEEGGKVSLAAAGLEGGVAFCLAVAKKRKSGKEFWEFSRKDWHEVGIAGGKGALKGGVRGASVYALSNFTATSANVASALVTAAYGVCAQADALRKKQITEEEFLINSEVLCLDVTVSAIAATLGQTVIPIPILGALIGNISGMFLYDIVRECCLEREQRLIVETEEKTLRRKRRVEEQFQDLLRCFKRELEGYSSILEAAFDEDVNCAFENSAALAASVGVRENRILKTEEDIRNFFCK